MHAEERRDAGEHEPLAPAEECVPVEGGAVNLAAEGRLAPLVVRPRAVARVDDVKRAQVARRALHAAHVDARVARHPRHEVAERAVRPRLVPRKPRPKHTPEPRPNTPLKKAPLDRLRQAPNVGQWRKWNYGAYTVL